MFLAFAAVIACGIDGIKRGLKLPPPVEKDPVDLDENTKHARHVTLLTQSFQDRKGYLSGQHEKAFDVGKPIRDLIGMRALENYISVQEQDHEIFSQMTFEQEVKTIIHKY